jgi:hypothetical protein
VEPRGPALTGARPGNWAGRLFAILSIAPACAVTGWVVASFPLAAFGVFWPLLVLPVAVAGAGVAIWLGLALLRQPRVRILAPRWSVAATAVIAAGFAVFTWQTHSEHVIPRRDAGSYIQIGWWLAHHRALTYPIPAGAFGPSPGDLTFGSPAFYEHGNVLVPQFMTGWPMLLAAADWVAGWSGMLLLPALVGGCAILAVAGLAARLVGARWAPLAALLLAVTWPVLRVAQATFSEPVALLILAGGSCLLVDLVAALKPDPGGINGTSGTSALNGTNGLNRTDGLTGAEGPNGTNGLNGAGGADGANAANAANGATQPDPGRIRRHALAAGLVLAGGELVRLDFGVDFALTLPVIAGLWLVYRRVAGPFLVGAAISGGLGVLDCVFVTRPYVAVNWSSVVLMIIAMAAIIAVTILGVWVARRHGRALLASRWWRLVPVLGGCAVLLVAAGLLIRPYVEVDHSTSNRGVINFTEGVQQELGLPLDGTRGYAEQSLWWVAWYLGWPLLAAALVAAVLLTVRVLRGRELKWAIVLLVYLGSSVLTLLRPGITPDHPWADRRLVVEVLPGMVLLATWTVAWANRWLRRVAGSALARLRARRPGSAGKAIRAGAGLTALPWVLTVVVVGVLLAPILIATGPVAPDRTELGELAAMSAVCRSLQGNDSVVLLDPLWVPTVRAQCRLPVAQLMTPSTAEIGQVAASIRAAGRTPVIAGSTKSDLAAVGLTPTRIVNLHTRQDQQQLVRRPTGTKPLDIEFWLARP